MTINISASTAIQETNDYQQSRRKELPSTEKRMLVAKVETSAPNVINRGMGINPEIKDIQREIENIKGGIKFIGLISPIIECVERRDYNGAKKELEKIKAQLPPEVYNIISNDLNIEEKADPALKLLLDGKIKEASIEIYKLKESMAKKDFDRMIERIDVLFKIMIKKLFVKNDLDGAADLIKEIKTDFPGNEFAKMVSEFESELPSMRLMQPAIKALMERDVPKAIDEFEKVKDQLPKEMQGHFFELLEDLTKDHK